jgi:hypothetical protein
MRFTAINTKANSSLQEYICAVHTWSSFYKGFCSMGCPLHNILTKKLKEQFNTVVTIISLIREEFEYYSKIVVVFLSPRCHIVTSTCDSRRGFVYEIGFIDHFSTRLVTTHLNIASWLISTIYKSLQHTLSIFSLLCLHQQLPGNSSNNGYSSVSVLKSSLNGGSLAT